jgi:hypothetical protein
MDELKVGDHVVVADVGTYGNLGVGEVIGHGLGAGKPVALVLFPGHKLVKLAGYDRYVVNKAAAA